MAIGLVSGDSLMRTANLPDPDEWTITGWFKQTADLDVAGVVAAIAHGSMSNYATVSISSDGSTIAASGNGGLSNLSPQPGVGNWYFFSIVRTAGDTFTVYWCPEGSNTFYSATGTCGSFVPGLILFGSTSGFETQGHYQYLRCWNAVLTQEQIEAERFSATHVRTANINFAWRLNNNSDTADQSGNSRNPTITGSLTSETGPNLSVGSSAPTITSAPSLVRAGQIGVEIEWTNGGASQGTGFVRICPSNDIEDVNGVNQTVTAWGASGGTINIVRGSLPLATDLYLFIKNDGGLSNESGRVIRLAPSIPVMAAALFILE